MFLNNVRILIDFLQIAVENKKYFKINLLQNVGNHIKLKFSVKTISSTISNINNINILCIQMTQ